MNVRRPTPAESSTVGRELLAPSYRSAQRRDPEFSALAEDALEDPNCDLWLDDAAAAAFVALADDATASADPDDLIGVVTVRSGESPPIYDRGRVATVDGLYVREGHRQEGVASRLLDRVERWAQEAGCAHVNAVVHVANDPSLALFEERYDERFRQFYLDL